MDAGEYVRRAYYSGGSGSRVLAFTYIVEVGDTSSDLDYYADEARSRSASSALNLNGGSIRRLSA
eukprot:8506769-Prorocentrum_lima.AAC.1